MKKNIRKNLFDRIDELKLQLVDISKQIETERQESNEDDNAIKQELIDKKDILESQISELQQSLKDTEGEDAQNYGKAYTIEVNGSKRTITLVHPAEADPTNGYVSIESPLAKAISGKKSGQVVDVETPAGMVSYKIL